MPLQLLPYRPSPGRQTSEKACCRRFAPSACVRFETPTFCRWQEATKSAEPACHKMPDNIKQARLARWADQMGEIDRLAALSLAQV